MRIVFILGILMVFSLWNFAQEFYSLYGTVQNKNTGEPLIHASIFLKKTLKGSITNTHGQFVLKYPKSVQSDTLVVSFLGYNTKEIPVFPFEDTIEIKMKPKKFQINEIIVHYRNPEKIIEKALNSISSNYNTEPLNMIAFYKEVIEEDDSEIQYAEAILKIYKGEVAKFLDDDRVMLLKGRIKPNLKKSILWHYIKFIDGPYDLLKADIAKNPNDFFTVSQNNLNFLKPSHFKYYDYTLLESYGSENELFAIQFKPKPSRKWVIYDGTIFIRKDNYAFEGIEYKFNIDRINLAHIVDFETRQALKEAGAIIKAVDFYSFVEFREMHGKMVFSQANIKYNFVFNEKITKDLFYITASSNLIITDIKTENVEKIKYKDQVKLRTTLEENITEIDPSFWENYNYMHNEY